MSHFAQIDDNNIVIQVLVIEQDQINTGTWGDPSKWIQTSYNTFHGVHYGPDRTPDGGTALRKNFAAIGYTYDPIRDAFIPPKLFSSWVLDEQTCDWVAPIPEPTETPHYWDEDQENWIPIPEAELQAIQAKINAANNP